MSDDSDNGSGSGKGTSTDIKKKLNYFSYKEAWETAFFRRNS